MSYIVTGGCGFIGSNFVNYLAEAVPYDIHVIDSLTYASNKSHISKNPRVSVYEEDITKPGVIDCFLKYTSVKGIFHFAAESHVDNSIDGPSQFVQTNIVGTFNLLESVRKHSKCRLIHISTDEVYGALREDGPSFLESKVLEPNNVYSATKASSDLLVRAYNKTYGLDVVTTRCCNNYGPRQHTEKLLPKVISNALNDVSIPVYGKGDNVREWIFVEDHCRAIWEMYNKGKSGQVYNIGSGYELSNLSLVKKVLQVLKKPYNLIKFVNDRPGHDFRYSIDCSKLRAIADIEYTDFNDGLKETIEWYKSLS
jgi:dTDP-glucose 4,6-dehydratase